MSESSKKELTVNRSDEWKPLADLLADLIAKYADEINFEELPDPEKVSPGKNDEGILQEIHREKKQGTERRDIPGIRTDR